MLDNFIGDLKAWAAKPYNEDGDLLDWVLFVGIWVVASILWVTVIKRVLD